MTQQQFVEEYAALPDEAQRQIADFMAFLRQKYQSSASEPSPKSEDLASEPFDGMWGDNQDLENSTDWVRSARQAEWGENS